MKRLFILLLLLQLGLTPIVSAQDFVLNSKRIDENLTISLPPEAGESDTVMSKNGRRYRFRSFSFDSEHAKFTLIITPNEINIDVDNTESYRIAIDGMTHGALKTMKQKGYACEVKDTLIRQIMGKKLFCRADNRTGYPRVIAYMYLLNDKMYMFQAAFFNREDYQPGMTEFSRFLETARFNTAPLKETRFHSKAESLGYRIGYALGPLLFIAAVVLIIYFLIRKKRS